MGLEVKPDHQSRIISAYLSLWKTFKQRNASKLLCTIRKGREVSVILLPLRMVLTVQYWYLNQCIFKKDNNDTAKCK